MPSLMRNLKIRQYNMGTYRLQRKIFTQYDDTDNLKRMKDSDILAEKKKGPSTGAVNYAAAGLGAGLAGATIGGAVGFARGKGHIFKKSRWAKVGKVGKAGLLVGAGIGLAGVAAKRSKERAANTFYNDRLEYAQRQAKRRERADWKANMTQRDGYSY